MAIDKKCEICGEGPAYKNSNNEWLCEKHYIKWVIRTFVVVAAVALIFFLI